MNRTDLYFLLFAIVIMTAASVASVALALLLT